MTDLDSFLSLSLSVSYGDGRPVFRDLFLQMRRGEVLGLVGGSGCGKSTLALGILRLLDMKGAHATGSVHFNGRNLLDLSEREMRKIRGREISLVLQSPSSALNPMLRIGTQLREAWRAHRKDVDGQQEIAAALHSVSLPSDQSFLRRFPSEISVGQGQRVLIAMAILHRPALLIADEPTSALDAITQIEVIELFHRINQEFQTGILLVSHDLFAIQSVCDRVAVLHEGKIVECDTIAKIFSNPRHPYTQALLQHDRAKPLYLTAGAQ